MATHEAMADLDTSEHHGIDIFIFSDSQAAPSSIRFSWWGKKDMQTLRKYFFIIFL